MEVKKLVALTTQRKPDAATYWSTRTMGKKIGVSASSASRHWRANGLMELVRDGKMIECLKSFLNFKPSLKRLM